MTKKAMWGLAAAAAIAFAVFAITGFPSVGRGTEGTIDAAKKYQTPQMANSDVKLGDAEAQEFFQSEVFDQLLKDPEARTLLADAELRGQLADKSIRTALADDSYRSAMARADFAKLFTDDELRGALEDAYRANAKAAVRQASVEAAARVNARAIVARAQSDASLKQVLDNEALRSFLMKNNAAFYRNLARVGGAAALRNASLARAVGARGFWSALSAQRMADALAAH